MKQILAEFEAFISVLTSFASMTDFWNIKERKAEANYSIIKVNMWCGIVF